MPRGRVGELVGRTVAGLDGQPLGRIADLVVDDHRRITAVLVVHGRWGRLLGYERAEMRGPWLLELFARRVWRRNAVEVPWERLRRDESGVPVGLG
jgi:sporulation protein YlmC with PRC-barrel domain